MLVQLHAQWRHAKSFQVLFFGAVRCFAMRRRASAVLDTVEVWGSSPHEPTISIQSLANAAFSTQRTCVAVCAITSRFVTRDFALRVYRGF